MSLNNKNAIEGLKEQGWKFEYELGTNFIGAYHEAGGSQSICEMRGRNRAVIGRAIADVLNSNFADDAMGLLKKYMAHILECEGTTYLDDYCPSPEALRFTDEEKRILERLDKELSYES